jgi:DNA-binding IclR family transcriptional regulator
MEIMRSVQRIIAVFESFTASKNALTLQEIADRIELPKSTTFRIIRSLEHSGYLVRLDNQRYGLSFRFTRLAGLVKSSLDIRTIARPVMSELAESTMETVALHTAVGRNRVCIDSLATTSAALRSVMQPGEQIPLHLRGSASKTLMAYMPKVQLTPLLPSLSRASKLTQAQLQAEFAQIRQQGYSVSHGERLLGLSAISAPIWDVNEGVRFCLTVNGPSVRIQEHEREYIKPVVRAAAEITLQYGGNVV